MKKLDHGIVVAKSNSAKKVGIKTADTIYMARKLCPNIKIYKSNKEIYKEFSDRLYDLLYTYSDKVERYSIDECFVDMTNCLMKRDILEIAKEIRGKIESKLGFTVNIGISENKLLAKMASDFEKPNKIHTLYKNEIQEKLWNLPVSELFMLGKKTVPKLHNMQIRTIGELAKSNRALLESKFGKHGKLIWEYANGIDDSKVDNIKKQPKCISKATTFANDIDNIEKLNKILYSLVEDVTYTLRKNKMSAKTIAVNIRTKDFVDYSHQKKFDYQTFSTKIIYDFAKETLNELYSKIKESKIRLIGVRLDNLENDEDIQVSMFKNENKEKQEKIDNILDKINDKYGNIVTRGNNNEQF